MRLTNFSLKRPITTIMTFVAAAAVGLISLPLIPLESLPELELPFLFVQAPYPNASPKEVETEIIRPLEEVISTMSGISRMNSNASRNGGGIFVLFGWNEDMEGKRIELRAKIDSISDQFPVDMDRVPIFTFNTSDQAMLQVRISSSRDLENAYEMLDRNLVKRLSRVEGVANVSLYGVNKRDVKIRLNPDRIAAHNVNLFNLRNQLFDANFSLSAGEINSNGQKWLLRPQGEFGDINDIKNFIVEPHNLPLSELAEVSYEKPEPDIGRHLNGTYAVGVDVFKQSGANLVDISEKVLFEISEVGNLPEMEGINLFVMNDLGEDVKNSLNELINSGLIGALMAFLVLFFFLRNIASTLIVALSVPFCLLITIGALYFFGYSLNILTLMGLILAIGMLVDNSVVVTENIFKKRQIIDDPIKATQSAVREVSLAITAGTMTSVIVFAPIVFGEDNGLTLFLKHIGFTIIVALLASLLIAQTLIPMLATRIKGIKGNKEGRFMAWLSNKYANVIGFALNRSWLSFFCIIGIIMMSVFVAKSDAFNLNMNEEEVSKRMFLQYNIRGIYPLEKTEANVNKIEAFLEANRKRFDIESIYSYYRESEAGTVIILNKDTELNPKEVQKQIEEEIPKIAIGTPSFERNNIGSSEGYSVRLNGDSTERLVEISREIIATLKGVDGLINVLPDVFSSGSELQVTLKAEKAAQLGINPQVVAASIATSLRGDSLRELRTDKGEIEIRIESLRKSEQTLASLRLLPIYTGAGDRVSLEQIANINQVYGSTVIRRNNRQTSLNISADFAENANAEQIKTDTNNVLNAYNFPPGYGWGFGQGVQDQDETMKVFVFNIVLAIPLIFMVMAALFESLVYPISIITSIGFSFIGVVFFFALTGTSFTIMSAIGMLILIGIVVNNGIVLIEHVNFLREHEQLPRTEAITQAGRDRLRPILMTVLTTVLGLVPLAFGDAAIAGGGPSYAPMARAIIGGLIFSTVVSLVVVPVVYAWLDGMSRWTRGIIKVARSPKWLIKP